jgi:hypothetical protein
MTWFESDGGPLVVLPQTQKCRWHGNAQLQEGINHYQRACKIDEFIACESIDGLNALVLGDEPLPTTWVKFTDRAGGVIVRWIACDSEEIASERIQGMLTPNRTEPGIKYAIDQGPLEMFDSAYPGSVGDSFHIEIENGNYLIYTTIDNANENCQFLFHYFERI